MSEQRWEDYNPLHRLRIEDPEAHAAITRQLADHIFRSHGVGVGSVKSRGLTVPE